MKARYTDPSDPGFSTRISSADIVEGLWLPPDSGAAPELVFEVHPDLELPDRIAVDHERVRRYHRRTEAFVGLTVIDSHSGQRVFR